MTTSWIKFSQKRSEDKNIRKDVQLHTHIKDICTYNICLLNSYKINIQQQKNAYLKASSTNCEVVQEFARETSQSY